MHPDRKPHHPKPGKPYNPTQHPTRHHPVDKYPVRHHPSNRQPERHNPTYNNTADKPKINIHEKNTEIDINPYPDVSNTHPKKPNTCDTSYDSIAVIRREVFIFKDTVSIQNNITYKIKNIFFSIFGDLMTADYYLDTLLKLHVCGMVFLKTLLMLMLYTNVMTIKLYFSLVNSTLCI